MKINLIGLSLTIIFALFLSACGTAAGDTTSTLSAGGAGLVTSAVESGNALLATNTTAADSASTLATSTSATALETTTPITTSGVGGAGIASATAGTDLTTDTSVLSTPSATTGLSGSGNIESSTSQATSVTSGAASSMDNPGLLSNLVTYPVLDENQQPVGQMNGFVIIPNTGQILYALVNQTGVSGADNRNVLVPITGLALNNGAGSQSPLSTGTSEATSSSTSMSSTTSAAGETNMGTSVSGSESTSMPTDSSFSSVGANSFQLQGITAEMLTNAPAFDINDLSSPGTSFDQEALAYWSSAGIAVTGAAGAATTTPDTGSTTATPGVTTRDTPGTDSLSTGTSEASDLSTATPQSTGTGSPSLTTTTAGPTGLVPQTGAANGSAAALITDVVDLYVVDASNNQVGPVIDAITDTSSANPTSIQYVVVASDQGQGNTCLAPIPWNTLTWGSNQGAGVSTTGTPSTPSADTITPESESLTTSSPMSGETSASTGTSESTNSAAGSLTTTPGPSGTLSVTTPGIGVTGATGGLTIGRLTGTLSIDPATLAQAPCFPSLSTMPDTTTPGWDAQIQSFWSNQGLGTGSNGTSSLTTTPDSTLSTTSEPAPSQTSSLSTSMSTSISTTAPEAGVTTSVTSTP